MFVNDPPTISNVFNSHSNGSSSIMDDISSISIDYCTSDCDTPSFDSEESTNDNAADNFDDNFDDNVVGDNVVDDIYTKPGINYDVKMGPESLLLKTSIKQFTNPSIFNPCDISQLHESTINTYSASSHSKPVKKTQKPTQKVDVFQSDSKYKKSSFLSDKAYTPDAKEIIIDSWKGFDFTNYPIFTVDNKKAKLLDDAIHIKSLEDDIIELAIHCVDFSGAIDVSSNSFIQNIENTKKTHKNCRYLPHEELEKISLKLGKVTKALTIIFVIDLIDVEIKDIWVGNSFIKVKAQLTFEDFDKVLSCKTAEELEAKYGFKFDGLSHKQLHNAVSLLTSTTKEVAVSGCDIKDGIDVIKELGDVISEAMALQLIDTYGDDLAIYNVERDGEKRTRFRSPIRKIFDLCALRQIEAMSQGMEKQDMALWVCGGSIYEFKKLFK
ncbi:RNB domain-containing protein [Entamoeba marina]